MSRLDSSTGSPQQTKLWSEQLFANGNKAVQPKKAPPQPARKAIAPEGIPSGHRKVEIEWYDEPKEENEDFIINSALDIAIEYGCNIVRIRKEIHNTATVWEAAPVRAPTEPRAMRVGNPRALPRLGRRKMIVPAPWHYTVEFHRMDINKWFTTHVYAETETVEIKDKMVEGVATGKLSVPDGKEIKQNPEVFDPTRFSKTSGIEHYTTNHFVPLKPRGTRTEQTKPLAQEPINKRLIAAAALERDPRR